MGLIPITKPVQKKGSNCTQILDIFCPSHSILGKNSDQVTSMLIFTLQEYINSAVTILFKKQGAFESP